MSDLISREALIKLLKDYGHSGDDDYIVEAVNTIPRITNAPAVSGEFGISFMKYTEFGVVPDDYKNQAGGYRAGWNDCIASVKYTITTPQQPQSVADALEEAAKICRKKSEDYASLAISSNEVKDFSSASICTHKKSVALLLEAEILALIKRNAKVVE